jgi:5-(carboxyamino)imidazole ribonucleotide mutase
VDALHPAEGSTLETVEPRRGAATSEVEPEELEPIPEVEAAFEEIEVDAPRVGIIMGSASDKPVMQPAGEELRERGIRFEVRVISAHRDPEAVAEYARNAHMRGLRAIIAGAGMSAALPGVVAANTDLPVIGVPIKAKNTVADGLDALLSVVQMPPGVPVACVAINGARNAAVLTARILGC